MSRTQKELKLFEAAMWILFLMAGILIAIACTGCQQPDTAWPPTVEFTSAQVDGYLVVETPAGVSRIDLSSGVVIGDADVKVTAWGVALNTSVSVNGQAQTLEATSENQGEVHCLDGRLGIYGMLVSGRWPLSPECGPSGLGEIVYRPFQ